MEFTSRLTDTLNETVLVTCTVHGRADSQNRALCAEALCAHLPSEVDNHAFEQTGRFQPLLPPSPLPAPSLEPLRLFAACSQLGALCAWSLQLISLRAQR